MVLLILTTIFSIVLFVSTFIKMVKRNNFNYLYLMIIEFIGIFIDFIFVIIGKNPGIIGYLFILLLSLIIPIVALALEKKGIYLSEIITMTMLKIKKVQSADKLIKLIEKNPNSYNYHKLLAEYYEKNNEKEKAEDEYIRALDIKPDDYKTYCRLATILSENNKKDEAIIVLQRLLQQKPDYYQGSILLGNILYDNENFKEALNIYYQALKYNPQEYDLYYNIGMTFSRLNDFQNAKEYYKKAALLNSVKDPASLNLGQIYLLFKEYDKAEKYFYETIKSDDEEISGYSYYFLAKVRLIQGEKEQAIQYANIAIDLYPKIINIIRKNDLFIPILSKLIVKTDKDVKTKVTNRERAVIKYLGRTFDKVETLTNDVQMKKEKEINNEKENENDKNKFIDEEKEIHNS